MERSQSLQGSQKCFLLAGPNHQWSAQGNEAFLYDEAEPLTYVCSETSMPPRISGSTCALRRADTSAAGGRSPSDTSGESVKDATARSQRSPEEATGTDLVDFKSEILRKLEELARRPNPNGSKHEECLESDGSFDAAKTENSKNERENLTEIFIRKKLFTSSSESERVRISSEELQEEVFSTGISDMEDVNHKDVQKKNDKRAQFLRENTSGLPQTFATKSIIKNMDARIEKGTAHDTPTRKTSPVQHRLSLRTITKPSCLCLLDEIRKNNLVLKEDIYASSSHKAGESLTVRTRPPDDNVNDRTRRHQKSTDITKSSIKQRTLIGTAAGQREFSQSVITTDAVDVYETTGTDNEIVKYVKRNPGTNSRQTSVKADVNALAVDLHYNRKRYEDFWRQCESEMSEEGTEPMKTDVSPSHEDVIEVTEDPKPLTPSNSEAKPSTPNRRPERYVKLPGLVEAFSQQNSNFKYLRIKDGTSFSSINAFQEMSMKNAEKFTNAKMKNVANQTRESNDVCRPFCSLEEQAVQKNRHVETKDACTDIRIPLVNMKTQTRNSGKTMIDCSVQCESQIVDEGRTKRNDHQEIMVCNDTGDGVQLYNELGHPLTDMDGYLLKDSLGRFLVRLDHFGVPVSCTNGQAIFMEDTTPWDAVKSHMSIIHQSRKKPFKRDGGVKKGRGRSSLHRLETAMRTLENTLGLVNKMPMDASDGVLERTYFGEGKRGRMAHKQDAAKPNTTSLIAEMKSIARLRNALLEKINFIADNRNRRELSKKRAPPGRKKSPSNSHDLLDDPARLAKQERPFSPTFQAIKKLVEDEGLNDWKNFRGAGITPEHETGDKTRGNLNDVSALWTGPVRGVGSDTPMSGRNQQSVPWMDDLPGSLNAEDANEVETDLWTFLKDNSKDTFITNTIDVDSNDELAIFPKNRYREIDDQFDGRVATMDNTIPSKQVEAYAGSRLLISLEKQYNLREGSWLETFEPPVSRPDKTVQARSERPSMEFSTGSTKDF